MKKFVWVPVLLIAAVFLASCAVTGGETQTAEVSESQEGASASVSASPEDGLIPALPGEELEEMPAVTEESCAFITAMSERPDGQADITFDYVEWLSGDLAKAVYMEDYPDVTEEEIEDTGILESGYVRNLDPALRTYPTGEETEYYLPDLENVAQNVPVSYADFWDRMSRTLDETDEGLNLAFVQVRVEEGVIARIEWLYRP